MTFKTGKRNPWHTKDAEIAKLKEQIADRDALEYRRAFANELGKSIMIMLAVIPMRDWPDIAKTAFRHHEDRMPTSAWDYKKWHNRANASRLGG